MAGGAGIAHHRQIEQPPGFLPVILVKRGDSAQVGERFGKRWVQGECLLGRCPPERLDFMSRSHPGRRHHAVLQTEFSVGRSKFRIESDCPLDVFLATRHRLGCQLFEVMAGPQQRFVCGKRGLVSSPLTGLRRKCDLQSGGNCRCDLILHREHIGQLAVEALRPEMRPVRRVDQLSRTRGPECPRVARYLPKSSARRGSRQSLVCLVPCPGTQMPTYARSLSVRTPVPGD